MTEFVVQLHPQREMVFGGILVFPGTPETVKKVFDGAAEWSKTASNKNGMIALIAEPPHIGKVRHF